SRFLGSSRLTFCRLCSRAPRMTIFRESISIVYGCRVGRRRAAVVGPVSLTMGCGPIYNSLMSLNTRPPPRSGTLGSVPSSNEQTWPVEADDDRLIAESLRGRTEAFGELVCRYQDRLFNAIYRLLGNTEDARDVVQEAFLHAYQALESFKGDSRFFTWLYRIAMNAAISWKRKQRAVLRLRVGDDEGGMEPLDDSPENEP